MKYIRLSNGIWTLELSEQGHFIALRNTSTELVASSTGPALCEVLYGNPEKRGVVASARLQRHTSTHAQFMAELDLGKPVTMRFAFDVAEPDHYGTAVRCKVELQSDFLLGADVQLTWPWSVRLPEPETLLFAPLFDGRGLRTTRGKRRAWSYVCSGEGGEGSRLALPMVDERSAGSRLHIAYFADPFFSTGIDLPPDRSPEKFQCRFLSAAGPRQFAERTFGIYLHEGDPDTALNGFFKYGIQNCPPGPVWLHEIALVHYDYLSENGEGWFRDIDKLVELFEQSDRERIVLTLHGWYDLIGRYCFDEKAGKLDSQWTVMPKGNRQAMTRAEIHRRVAYAKERGFRVLLYFADGLAIDEGAPNFDEQFVFHNPDGSLRRHHWAGPDTISQTYVMNPLHPHVQSFFRGYMTALLNEYGSEIDGLTWDETFTTRVGDISSGEFPGYADRAFMMLCSELRNLVKAKNPGIAFLASDCAGLSLPQEDGTYWSAHPAQNAIVFDGTYQDSQCYPTAWQYGIFPNYRNTLWSCNWKPVENFEWTVLGVKAFGAPVAISNGWGENRGISHYSEEELEKLLDLFRLRKQERCAVRWIESSDF